MLYFASSKVLFRAKSVPQSKFEKFLNEIKSPELGTLANFEPLYLYKKRSQVK